MEFKDMTGWIGVPALVCVLAAGVSAPHQAVPSPRHIDRSMAWSRTGKTVLTGFRNMYHGTVLQTGTDTHPFRMWFMGWAADDTNTRFPGCDAIFLARGKNLDTWEVYAGDGTWDATMTPDKWVPVVTARDKPYDGWHAGDPSVVHRDGRYYMAYSATGPDEDGILFGRPGDTDGDIYCVMGAVSDDGITWRRSEEPIVIHRPEMGKPGDPKSDAVIHGMYHRPSLMFDNGRWRLWFDYWTGSDVAMGYAEGEEGEFLRGAFRVLRAGDNPLLHEWPNPAVIKVGAKYYSFADPSGYGIGWAGRQLAEAESDDGLTWRILGWISPDPDTPACHVPSPALVRWEEAQWLVVFYACQIGGEPEYNYRYDRMRYMRRRIPGTP